MCVPKDTVMPQGFFSLSLLAAVSCGNLKVDKGNNGESYQLK